MDLAVMTQFPLGNAGTMSIMARLGTLDAALTLITVAAFLD